MEGHKSFEECEKGRVTLADLINQPLPSDECGKSRVALADVTNRKRGFSSISSNVSVHSGNKKCESFHKGGNENSGTKCVEVSEKGCIKRACLTPRISAESSPTKEIAAGEEASKVSKEIKGPKSLDSEGHSSGIPVDIQVVDDSSSCGDRTSIAMSKSESDGVEVIGDSDEGHAASHGDDAHGSEEIECDQVADNLNLSQSGSFDYAKFPDSQESRTVEVERCSGLKADECLNLTTDNLIKDCSCSFCTKAGYVWLDLHYQDMQGRLTAIKRVQRDAGLMVDRSFRTSKHAPGSSRASNLENDLMAQWRSLFKHMRETYAHEGNQLESNMQSLKDLRDKCKTDLETINGKAPQN